MISKDPFNGQTYISFVIIELLHTGKSVFDVETPKEAMLFKYARAAGVLFNVWNVVLW